jgi:hypothetical protein
MPSRLRGVVRSTERVTASHTEYLPRVLRDRQTVPRRRARIRGSQRLGEGAKDAELLGGGMGGNEVGSDRGLRTGGWRSQQANELRASTLKEGAMGYNAETHLRLARDRGAPGTINGRDSRAPQ